MSGAVSKNYIHTLRATRRGQMQYGIKEGMSEVLLMTDTSQGDQETIRVKDLGTHMKTISVSSTRDKLFRVLIDNQEFIPLFHQDIKFLKLSQKSHRFPGERFLREIKVLAALS